ncbi:MAG: hypothetical protein AAFZ87_16155, partial [Planctomycetota bacterium]
MCGIVGALVANGSVTKGLVEGLSVLEYRGYDSAGVAVVKGGEVCVRKRRGRLANLEEALSDGALDLRLIAGQLHGLRSPLATASE